MSATEATATAPEIRVIEISRISMTEDAQPREKLDRPTVEAYQALYEEKADLPPIIVFSTDTALKHYFFLADGFHRVEGAKRAGRSKIQAEVHRGDKRDALLHAVGANATHGLRRTNADKRRCVQLLLADLEWSKWSDREIAKRTGVSNKFVSNMRNELAGVNGTQVTERTGGDGKVYSIPTQKPKTEPTPETKKGAETIEIGPAGKWCCPKCTSWWDAQKYRQDEGCQQCALEAETIEYFECVGCGDCFDGDDEHSHCPKCTRRIESNMGAPASAHGLGDIVVDDAVGKKAPAADPKSRCPNCDVVAGIGCTCAMSASGFVEGMKAACSNSEPSERETFDDDDQISGLLPFEIREALFRYVNFHSAAKHFDDLVSLKGLLHGVLERIEHEFAKAAAR